MRNQLRRGRRREWWRGALGTLGVIAAFAVAWFLALRAVDRPMKLTATPLPEGSAALPDLLTDRPIVRVLAIDGGGVRGIIPAMLLTEIERRTGIATCDLFDLFAGTSTGSIVVCGVLTPGAGDRPKLSRRRRDGPSPRAEPRCADHSRIPRDRFLQIRLHQESRPRLGRVAVGWGSLRHHNHGQQRTRPSSNDFLESQSTAKFISDNDRLLTEVCHLLTGVGE